MNSLTKIQAAFDESIKTKQLTKEKLADYIVDVGKIMVGCLQRGNKILCCGNGGSAADAQHFVAELLNRLKIERRPLPAITLNTDTSTITAIANDYSFDDIFAKPLLALGNENDILLVITTSGNSKNLLKAIRVAHELNITVVALTGCNGGLLATKLQEGDVEIRVPSEINIRIQETHILILHCLCEIIDEQLFGISKL